MAEDKKAQAGQTGRPPVKPGKPRTVVTGKPRTMRSPAARAVKRETAPASAAAAPAAPAAPVAVTAPAGGKSKGVGAGLVILLLLGLLAALGTVVIPYMNLNGKRLLATPTAAKLDRLVAGGAEAMAVGKKTVEIPEKVKIRVDAAKASVEETSVFLAEE